MNSQDLWAVVPVKPFRYAKTRLAQVLDDVSREKLCAMMLEDVMKAIVGARKIVGWGIVSKDSDVLALARGQGGLAISDNGHDLNSSLTIAAREIRERNGGGLLILPMDVPLVTSDDIDFLAGQASPQSGITLVPSRDGGGTNALIARPVDAIPFAFGLASYLAHEELARTYHLSFQALGIRNLALDIDLPNDLADLAKTAHERYGGFHPDGIHADKSSIRRVGAGNARH